MNIHTFHSLFTSSALRQISNDDGDERTFNLQLLLLLSFLKKINYKPSKSIQDASRQKQNIGFTKK